MQASSFPEPTPLYVAHRNDAPTAAKMNLYELQDRFWQLNDEQAFTANETRLYFYLLNHFNRARWAATVHRTITQLAADLRADQKTVDASRRGLELRGLVGYVAGNKSTSATWRLLIDGKNSSQSSTDRVEMQRKNSSAFMSEPTDRVEMQRKNSSPYKEEEKIVVVVIKDKDPIPVAADAAVSGSEKKIGLSETASSDMPQRPASHTGGALTGVSTRKERRAKPAPTPAELLPADCLLADLLNPGGDAARVQLLAQPLTADQAAKLLADFAEPALRDILCQMANWQKLLTSATSAHLTVRNWLAKRAKTAPAHDPGTHDFAQTRLAGHGLRTATAVHANPFGVASAQSLAIARALARGGDGGHCDLD